MAIPPLNGREIIGDQKNFRTQLYYNKNGTVDMMPYRNNGLKETLVADTKLKTLIKTFPCLIATLIRHN